MDLTETLMAEHSKAQVLRIEKYIGNDKKKFSELVRLFLNSEYRITQRAAWPLSNIAVKYPELIKPYLPKLIDKLNRAGEHPAIPRNILRILQEINIPEKYHGVLIGVCFKFIVDASHSIAVRAFAITVAANICSGYPELGNELILLLDELKKYPQQPAITSRIKSAFKRLKSGK